MYLTGYMKSKLPVNFPTCPVCRKIITVSLREIHKFEHARAESDILALVRKIETCGICKEKKNPKIKCVDCGKFICDDCKLHHAYLEPKHTLEAIVLTSECNQSTYELCKRHKDQTLDLFCVMCQTLMCLYCEKYEHAKCKAKYKNGHVLEKFRTGLLKSFVQESGERRYLHKSGRLERLVYVKEFATESRKWLGTRKTDLDDEVEKIESYKLYLDDIIDEQVLPVPELKFRSERIRTGHDETLDCAKLLQKKATDVLESLNDSEVVKVILDMEQLISCFLEMQNEYSMYVRPLKLTFEQFDYFNLVFKAISSCKLINSVYSFACILRIKTEDIDTPNIRSAITFDSKAVVELHSVKSALTKRINDKNDSVYNRAVFVERGHLENYHCFFHKYGRFSDLQMALNFSNSCTYIESPVNQQTANQLMEQSKHDVQKASWQYFGRRAPSCHPCSFYVETSNDDNPRICLRVGSEMDERYGNLDNSLFYITHFTNVYGDIFNFPIGTLQYTCNEMPTVCLTAITGKATPFSGLETLFIYFTDDIQSIHAVSVSSAVAKFNVEDSLDSNYIQTSTCHMITDELGIFSLCNATSDNGECFYSTFRSHLNTSDDHENFISAVNFNGQYQHPIPLMSLNVDLLCYFKMGLYFVKRESEYDALTVGKLTQNPMTGYIQEEMICSLNQTEFNVPIRKLKPLTMVETRKEELVVMCSVEHSREKATVAALFVMIYPNREGADVVELLEVVDTETAECGANTRHGTIVDAEMDPDGNITYVVQQRNGNSSCVFTKHFTA